jgi:hypothetical protein
LSSPGRVPFANSGIIRTTSVVEGKPARADLAKRIAQFLQAHEGKIRRKQLAAALGQKKPEEPGGTFRRALDYAVQEGWIVNEGRGYYRSARRGRRR